MQIEVHQRINTRFSDEAPAGKMNELHHVATLTLHASSVADVNDALEHAFTHTNSMDAPWPKVKVPGLEPQRSTPANPFHDRNFSENELYPFRSTSVGDMMKVTIGGRETWYMVQSCGFREVPTPEKN